MIIYYLKKSKLVLRLPHIKAVLGIRVPEGIRGDLNLKYKTIGSQHKRQYRLRPHIKAVLGIRVPEGIRGDLNLK